MKSIIFFSLFYFSSLAWSSPRVESDLNRYDNHIKNLKITFNERPQDPNNKDWVKFKLAHMVKVDQYMRNFMNIRFEKKYSKTESDNFLKKFGTRWKAIDYENNVELKKLLKIYTWFRISEFGKGSDQNAWLLVQHADHDIEFQKQILKILDKLWPLGETQAANYAYLYDRIAASWQNPKKRQLQKYGTQGSCVAKGKWEPIAIIDPKNVNIRRKSVGLLPIEDYTEGFKSICK